MNVSMKMKTNLHRVLGVSIILSALLSCRSTETNSSMTGIPVGDQKAVIKQVLSAGATASRFKFANSYQLCFGKGTNYGSDIPIYVIWKTELNSNCRDDLDKNTSVKFLRDGTSFGGLIYQGVIVGVLDGPTEIGYLCEGKYENVCDLGISPTTKNVEITLKLHERVDGYRTIGHGDYTGELLCGKVDAIKLINDQTGRSYGLGWSSYYATMAPGGGPRSNIERWSSDIFPLSANYSINFAVIKKQLCEPNSETVSFDPTALNESKNAERIKNEEDIVFGTLCCTIKPKRYN